MDARDTAERVGTEVSKAIGDAGFSSAAIAEAICLDQSELDARMNGAAEFSINELIEVGGLLGVPASTLLAGVA